MQGNNKISVKQNITAFLVSCDTLVEGVGKGTYEGVA